MFRALINYLIGPPSSNGDNNDKYNSRRYRTMWALTTLIFMIFVFPPVISYIMTITGIATLQFVILDDAIFSTILALIWGTYLASDFATKSLGEYREGSRPHANTKVTKSTSAETSIIPQIDPPYESDRQNKEEL